LSEKNRPISDVEYVRFASDAGGGGDDPALPGAASDARFKRFDGADWVGGVWPFD
jgi:hypothetical protein